MQPLPPEVVAFLGEIADVRDEELMIHPLAPEQASEATAELWRVTVGARQEPLPEQMGLMVLEAGDEADPYCYATRGLAAGTVVLYPHDARQEIAFASLKSFGEALRGAIASRTMRYDICSESVAGFGDQTALVPALLDWLKDPEGELCACLYLPLLHPDDVATLRAIAMSTNFFIREAAASFMHQNTRPAHLPLLEALARDRYDQVSRPAIEGLRKLGAPAPR